VVDRTAQPFIQAIQDLESPRMVLGRRSVIIGGAAFVARPHVGMGVTKAAGDADALVQAIIENIAKVMPVSHVGVRLSPTAGYNSPRDPDPKETYGWVAAMLQRQGVAFIEIADTNAWAGKPDRDELLRMIGPHFTSPLILNGGLTPDKAGELVSEGSIDLASFAR
jgi:flavin-dependent dehydrogenase